MSQSIIKTQPINVTGLRRLKIVPPRAKELMGMIDETMEILKKRGLSLTVEDFLKERER
jgi:hypothetical protein